MMATAPSSGEAQARTGKTILRPWLPRIANNLDLGKQAADRARHCRKARETTSFNVFEKLGISGRVELVLFYSQEQRTITTARKNGSTRDPSPVSDSLYIAHILTSLECSLCSPDVSDNSHGAPLHAANERGHDAGEALR